MYDSSSLKNSKRWYESSKADLHSDVSALVESLSASQSYRPSENLRFARLYGNYDVAGLDSLNYTRIDPTNSPSGRITLNIIQSMIDTVVSKIAKNKPKPTFLTQDGDYYLQEKAKKLTKFCEGVFHSSDIYAQARLAFLDSCIFGTGALKIISEEGCIRAERAFINEIIVDDKEAFYAKPRQIHQVKYIHKDVLKSMFPDKASFIDCANQVETNFGTVIESADEMIKVIESWHLPSKKVQANDKKAYGGRHCITISNVTLFDEPWKHNFFPFVFMRWGVRPVGFFGQGLAEQLQGLQLEINKILRTIQLSMHLVSIPKIFVEANSKIVKTHLNNMVGGIVEYIGKKPEGDSLGTIPAELFSHLDRLYQRSYEIAGISQLSAQSSKLPEVSGVALREYNDIETERFMSIGQRFEESFLDAAEIMVSMAKSMYENGDDLKVKVKGKKFIETIEWSEVDIEDDKYMMHIFPTSSLSSTPSGRLQDVQDLMSAGLIEKEMGLKLLDFPDLEGAFNLMNAAYENIEKMVSNAMEKGIYTTPEPYQNLELGIKLCQEYYLKYQNQNAPDDRLELLRRWMEDAQGLMRKAQNAESPVGTAAQAPDIALAGPTDVTPPPIGMEAAPANVAELQPEMASTPVMAGQVPFQS